MANRLRCRMLIASGMLVVGLFLTATAWAQPEPAAPPRVVPSITVDPDEPGATPHWTITLGTQYCGGYRVGDGVYLSPEAPLALPSTLADGSALFAGQPATVDWVDGALRINPGPGLVLSMICITGQRPLKVELLPDAGFSLPTDPGDYAVDVWTGADSSPINLAFTLPSADDAVAPAQD